MKRILALLLVLLLAVPMTAHAVQPLALDGVTYEFEWDGDMYFDLPAQIPDGDYIATLYDEDASWSSDVFSVEFSFDPDTEEFGYTYFSIEFDSESSCPFTLGYDGASTYLSLDAPLSDYGVWCDRFVLTPVVDAPSDVDKEAECIANIERYVVASADYLRIIAGCAVFAVVVALCCFVYKFFRIFF